MVTEPAVSPPIEAIRLGRVAEVELGPDLEHVAEELLELFAFQRELVGVVADRGAEADDVVFGQLQREVLLAGIVRRQSCAQTIALSW